MRTVVSLGLLAAAAWAACPNQCSGHGYCDENDRCTCYRGPGTKGNAREMWTGYDCAQRVCPYGDSFDVISDVTQELLEVNAGSTKPTVGFIPAHANSVSKMQAFVNNGLLFTQNVGVDVRIVSVDTSQQTANFQFKLSTERTFNTEVTLDAKSTGGTAQQYCTRGKAYHVRPDLNRDGAPDDSGLFVFFEVASADVTTATQTLFPGDIYYVNVTFNEGKSVLTSDQNTVHPAVECSGRGICDRIAGVCKCDAGYGGDACQRMTCPKDCSGHGTCQTLRLFVEEGNPGKTYSGVDATQQTGCKCDAGFRGADCSQVECPSGPDPQGGGGGAGGYDCSGRGICDFAVGTCRCFKGFFGERCEEITNLV